MALFPVLIALAILLMGAEHNCTVEDEEQTKVVQATAKPKPTPVPTVEPTASVVLAPTEEPKPTSVPTVEPTASVVLSPTEKSESSSCQQLPDNLIAKIESGLVDAGAEVTGARLFDAGDPLAAWRFIGVRVENGGSRFHLAVGTWSSELDGSSEIFAGNILSEQFFVWGLPAKVSYMEQEWKDEADGAVRCAEGIPE